MFFLNLYKTKLEALSQLNLLNKNSIKSKYHLFSQDTHACDGSKYFLILTYIQLYKIILHRMSINKFSYFYENFELNNPVKLFFDIDIKHKSINLDLLINQLISFIIPFLPHSPHLRVLCLSSSPSTIFFHNVKKPNKTSLHIIFTNLHFSNIYALKNFISVINIKSSLKFIDTSVYKVGSLRCYACAKRGFNNVLHFYKLIKIKNNNISSSHLSSYHFPSRKIFLLSLITNISKSSLLIQ